MSITTVINHFSVSTAGQVFTPLGTIQVPPDIRPRTPSGTLTFNGSDADNTQYDVYAQMAALNTYVLVAVLRNAAAPTNSVLVGYATNYPSISQAYWIPLAGGSLDPYVGVAADATYVRLGVASTINQYRIDNAGRAGMQAGTAPACTVLAAAGTGATAVVAAGSTDQQGVITIVAGTVGTQSAGAQASIAFARRFVNAALGVNFWGQNDNAANPKANPYFTWTGAGLTLGHVGFNLNVSIGLTGATTYIWSYEVLSVG